MIKLCELRDEVGVPITQLVHEAIAAYYHMLTSGNGHAETDDIPDRD